MVRSVTKPQLLHMVLPEGDIAQLEEHLPGVREGQGSNPHQITLVCVPQGSIPVYSPGS